MWKKYFPASEWLPNYTIKILGSDAIAGITLAAYAIPVSLAYAMLAGLPPQYGIYGYLLGGLLYAMLGSGRQLAVGPTSAISLLIGVTIAGMANGDTQRWADIASLTALVFAVMSILAYLLRLNGIIDGAVSPFGQMSSFNPMMIRLSKSRHLVSSIPIT